jgi:uncharacterized membrane protein YedE/YeeE
MNRIVLAVALAGIAAVAALAWTEGGWRLGVATAIGAVAGLGLYHASFGFTAAWRRLVRERRGAGLRAQMLLIGLACAFSFPLMAWGETSGVPARGSVLPMGVASALGAFVFGIGMQLGGGCASGTLFTAGGGSVRMLLVLAFFIAGSVSATAHWDFWSGLPHSGAGVSIPGELGTIPGLLAMLAAVGAIAAASILRERRRHGSLEPRRPTVAWLTGPWSLAAGAVILAAVSIATLAVLGQPWGITSAFALWGAKAAAAAGLPVETWAYWAPGWRQAQLASSVFANGTSVMNFGIVLGAMAAAALAGKFAPAWNLSARDVATAAAGGLLMGYGARLAYGCNIGAFLGGMVSGSLHGWWWLVWGFLGSLLGTWARQRIGMDPPAAPSALRLRAVAAG